MKFEKYGKSMNKYGLIVFFVIFYFAVRMPFFGTGWDGGDANGLDVDMFVNHPQNPNYLLIARINGEDMYAPATGHPGPMYEMFSQLGNFFQKFEDYQKLSDAQIIYRIKVISATVQLVIFFGLMWLIFKNEKKGISLKNFLLYLGLLIFSITPIAISNSNEFQVDSFFGLLMLGFYGLVLFAKLEKQISVRLFYGLLFLSAVFLGLGKNEWSLLLILSLFAAVLYLPFKRYILKRQENESQAYLIVGISSLGCVFGNLLSYLFEPALYWSGWELLLRMSGQASILSKDGLEKFGRATEQRMIFLFPMLLMFAYLTFFILKNIKRNNFIVVLGYFLSAAFFFSFFLSTWGFFARYFAPAFVMMLIATCMVYLEAQQPIGKKTSFLVGLVFLWMVLKSFAYLTDSDLQKQYIFGTRDISAKVSQNPNCIFVVPVEDAYRHKEINFVHLGMGMDYAKQLAKEKGLETCLIR